MGVEELFQTIAKENTQPIDAKIRGHIPEWIEGSLYRNGPGKFEFGNTKYNHWFDGMAMIHRFKISKGKVAYQDKFVESAVYRKNMGANKIICSEFGTMAFPDPCKSWFERIFSYFTIPPSTDNTVVNVFPIGERLYAATETNLINRIDPETLATKEQVNLTEVVSLNGATAHPHWEADGTVFNIGSVRREGYTIVKITPTGKDEDKFCEKAEIVGQISPQWKLYPSYMHSFGMTENYFIFIEQPLAINVLKILTARLRGKAFNEAMEYFPEYPVKFHVIDRKTNKKVNPETNYITDAFIVFHHINAYEENGQLVVDACILDDPSAFQCFQLHKLQAPGAENWLASFPTSLATRYVLPLDLDKATSGQNLVSVNNTTSTAIMTEKADKNAGTTREVRMTKDILSDVSFDFPQINYNKCNARKYRYVYGTGSQKTTLDCITRLDLKTREMKIWSEKNIFPSEPVFVASPNAEEEDDGVLLVMILTTGTDRSAFLLVLDARTLDEIGRAEVPVKIGRDMHGSFVPSSAL